MINRTISRTHIYFFQFTPQPLVTSWPFSTADSGSSHTGFLCAKEAGLFQKGSRLLVKSIEVLRPIESVMEVCNMDELDFKSVNFHSPADVLG